jgi:1-acyl-sn-glycerol-3-phosphate acyltransferase
MPVKRLLDPLRTLPFYGTFLGFTGACGSVAGASALLGDRQGRVWWPASQLWASALTRSAGVTDFIVEGLDRFDDGQPYLLMCNHESHLDPPSIIRASRRPVVFLTKEELRRIPVFGWSLEQMGHIFIDRKHAERARDSIEAAAARVREGRCVLVFPEGTRSQGEEMLPFKKGGFVLAVKSGVPIVPLAIAGTRAIFPSQSRLIRGHGPVALVAGEPIPTEGYTLETKEALMDRVREAISELRERARALLADRP